MLIDAHTHLDKYGDELTEVLGSLEERRILTVSMAVDPASFVVAESIAARSDLVVASFGVHPWEAPAWVGRLDEVQGLIERSPMVGEVGRHRLQVQPHRLLVRKHDQELVERIVASLFTPLDNDPTE